MTFQKDLRAEVYKINIYICSADKRLKDSMLKNIFFFCTKVNSQNI